MAIQKHLLPLPTPSRNPEGTVQEARNGVVQATHNRLYVYKPIRIEGLLSFQRGLKCGQGLQRFGFLFFWPVTQERVCHGKLLALKNLELTSITWQPESNFPLKPTKAKEEKPKVLPEACTYHPVNIPRAFSSNRAPEMRPTLGGLLTLVSPSVCTA